MSTQTTNLKLFKYDPLTDGSQTFNVDTALNDNWDKVDIAVGTKGKKASITAYTLAAANWVGTTYTLTVTGYNKNTMIAKPTPSTYADMEKYADSEIWASDGATDDTITFKANRTRPSTNIAIVVELTEKEV